MDQYTDTVLTCEAIVRKKNGAHSLKRALPGTRENNTNPLFPTMQMDKKNIK